MSRTDKDMPVWASAEYYEPVHDIWCVNAMEWRGRSRRDRPCDLPAEPIRHPPMFKGGRRGCSWDPIWPRRGDRRYWCTWGPKREDRHFNWWGPDRTKVRDQMSKAKQEYNGSHEVEIVERVDQHRHAPVSGWWD